MSSPNPNPGPDPDPDPEQERDALVDAMRSELGALKENWVPWG